MKYFQRFSVVSVSSLLIACGGGGSDTNANQGNSGGTPGVPGTTIPTVNAPYRIEPGILVAESMAGYSAQIELKAIQSDAVTGLSFVKIVPNTNVIDPDITIISKGNTVTVHARTSRDASPGLYSGNITINACTDVTCNTHLAGSPFKLPYRIEIFDPKGSLQKGNLAPLSAVPGAADWGTYQGNAAHTGYAAISVSPANFTQRWRLVAPAGRGGGMDWLDPSTTGSGLVFLSYSDRIEAIREHDGTLAWSRPADNPGSPDIHGAAYMNRTVYYVSSNKDSTRLHGVDAVSGAPLWSAPIGRYSMDYYPPVVYKDRVFGHSYSTNELYVYSASGDLQFKAPMTRSTNATPAVADRGLFLFAQGELHIFDPVNGEKRSVIDDP